MCEFIINLFFQVYYYERNTPHEKFLQSIELFKTSGEDHDRETNIISISDIFFHRIISCYKFERSENRDLSVINIDNCLNKYKGSNVLRIETYLSLTLIIASRNMRAAMYLAFSVISLLMGFYFGHGRAQLSDTFYAQTCPNLESTVTQAVTAKTQETFVAIPATLRLFFHDCFVEVKKK